MKKPKLALSMIVKDDSEAEILNRCLSSIASYVDGVYITITNSPSQKLKRVIAKYGGVYSHFDWTDSFEEARNYAMSQIPEDFDYMLWTDSDDVWVGAEYIPLVVEQMANNGVTGVWMTYNYDIGEDGEVYVVHDRERITKLGYYTWKGHLHETLVPTREVQQAKEQSVHVDHYPTGENREEGFDRNRRILERMYKDEGQDHDPRTEYYLGRTYYDLHLDDECERLMLDYLKHSGWNEERAFACHYIARIAMGRKQWERAVEWLLRAIHEKSNFPTWYSNLGFVYAQMGKMDDAAHYARMFANTPRPKSAIVFSPIDDKIRYYETLYMIAMGAGKTDEAISTIKELLALVPDFEEYQQKLTASLRLKELVDITKAADKLVKELERTGEYDKIQQIIAALPRDVEKNAYVAELRNKYLPPKTWSNKSIVYFCGKGFEEWGPWSLDTGLGGSETAVVNLSKEWVKQGYSVTVYAYPGVNEGVYDGVEYLNFYRFNPKDEFNTLILWRQIGMVDLNFKAKRIWIDLHDVPNGAEFTPERLKKVERIYVKSNYHRSLLPIVPDELFRIISNGADPALLQEGVERNPDKIIWASSYDRGLDLALEIGWPIIKKYNPKAEFHIFYGWNLFDAINGDNPERMMWKAKVQKLMEQPGVIHHGRVGHKELMKHRQESAVHFYPTYFEEIDCISIRESALAGCVPITTRFAALAEKLYGVMVKGDPYSESAQKEVAEQVGYYSGDNIRPLYSLDIKKQALRESWINIAKGWHAA